MVLLQKPSEQKIYSFLASQQNLPFSYAEVGASREGAPSGYTMDHNRVRLGEGPEAFTRAVEAVQRWEMFHLDWLQLLWPDVPIQVGVIVGVLVHHFAFWSLNACRIVYTIEEEGPVRSRYGFAYGTLPEHAECGEERFGVEWDREDNSVWYDLFAFSRPNHFLVWSGYPLSRILQKRFARDSGRAMAKAVSEPLRHGGF